jgi:hypothetical protein
MKVNQLVATITVQVNNYHTISSIIAKSMINSIFSSGAKKCQQTFLAPLSGKVFNLGTIDNFI